MTLYLDLLRHGETELVVACAAAWTMR